MATNNRKRNRSEFDDNSENIDPSNQPAPKAMRKNDNSRVECKEWNCTVCTLLNPTSAAHCSICEEPKPTAKDNEKNTNAFSSFLCIQCHLKQGYHISCTQKHKICIECCKAYIVDGINTDLWKKQALTCPSPECTDELPHWLIQKCELDNQQKLFLQSQQNIYSRFIISQMNKCNICCDKVGIVLQCEHNLCVECGKQCILGGIADNKWKSEKLCCPVQECDSDSQLTLSILKQFNLSTDTQTKLESMQNEFFKQSITADPNNIECPKCHTIYSKEIGDIKIENVNNKLHLSSAHKLHKTRFRFRCLKPGCTTVFCSGCNAIPYHIGYSCEEYKEYKQSKKCRFCDVIISLDSLICTKSECAQKQKIACDKIYDCGHQCIGMKGHKCFGCLNTKCVSHNSDINEEEFCNICWVDSLKVSPTIKLECGHYFHYDCVKEKCDKKWPSARITFGFLNCPLCKKEMKNFSLDSLMVEYYKLKTQIQKEAIERVKIEGLQNDKRLTDKNSRYYNNLAKFSMDRLAFYPCSKCNEPYFGGMKACEEAGNEREEKYNQKHLICGACSSGGKKEVCATHGTNYISYKCKFCCSLAVWFCWGTTHFCDPCHSKAGQVVKAKIYTLPKCKGKDKCPLGVAHAANGTAEVCLGCVVCLRK